MVDDVDWEYISLRSILEVLHEAGLWCSQFRQYGTVPGNLETMQVFQRGENPLRHSAACFGGSAKRFHHSAVFWGYLTLR